MLVSTILLLLLPSRRRALYDNVPYRSTVAFVFEIVLLELFRRYIASSPPNSVELMIVLLLLDHRLIENPSEDAVAFMNMLLLLMLTLIALSTIVDDIVLVSTLLLLISRQRTFVSNVSASVPTEDVLVRVLYELDFR